MSGKPAAVGFEVHSELSGRHWVAWISLPGDKGPHRSILLVGATREEAETRAQEWAARVADQNGKPPSSA